MIISLGLPATQPALRGDLELVPSIDGRHNDGHVLQGDVRQVLREGHRTARKCGRDADQVP